jgi:hypothetical protein
MHKITLAFKKFKLLVIKGYFANEILNAQDLKRIVSDIWSSLPLHYVRSLYVSLPRRIWCVLRSRRHISKYWRIPDYWCTTCGFPVVSTTYTFRMQSFISLSPDINFAILPKYYLCLITENYMWPLIVMFWGCISYYGVGTLTPVEGNMNTEKYISVLDDNLWPVIARHFSNRLDFSGG